MCSQSSCLLAIVTIFVHTTFVKSLCYYPNGGIADDVPCTTDLPFTYCCGLTGTCLGNKVCLQDGAYDRGSCTDKQWDSLACPQFCQSTNPDGGGRMIPCPPLESGIWCCDGQDCCQTSSLRFFLGSPTALPRQNSSSSPSTSTSSITASRSLSAFTSTSFPIASESSSSRGGSSAISSSPPSQSSTSTSNAAASSGLAVSAKAGLGAGVPIFISLIALVMYLLYRNKQLRGSSHSLVAQKNNHPKEHSGGSVLPQEDLQELEQREEYHELPTRQRRYGNELP